MISTTLTPTNPVILNLFQDPFRVLSRSVDRQLGRAVWLLSATPALAARWVLKQVQHDDVLWEVAK